MFRAEATGREDERLFAPPSLGKERVYLCSAGGEMVSLRQSDGEQVLLCETDLPMTFQPVVAEGNVHVGTANGLLLC